jgi:Domain of unknown function (DUF932)
LAAPTASTSTSLRSAATTAPSAFRILVTPVPVVCSNTQSAALSNHESSFSIRHTRNANSAVQTAREALGLTSTYVDAFQVEDALGHVSLERGGAQ